MNTQAIFRSISKSMFEEFKISAEVAHKGSRGSYREESLKNFLSSGRLPFKYGVGSGEIIGPKNETSKQCDIIIYDKLEGIPLVYQENIQVFPIENVYGTIEVKSSLSKPELIQALENVKSVKSLSLKEAASKITELGTITFPRPTPFGAIFAYNLSGNSIESLTDNLKEWEKENSPEHWPNIIAVLGHGIIYHADGKLNKCLSNQLIGGNTSPMYLMHRHDSLFHFYATIVDLCSKMSLGPVDLHRYFDLPKKVGKYFVRHHGRIMRFGTDGKVDNTKVYAFSEQFIEKIVTWCKARGKMKYSDIIAKQLGSQPYGVTEEEYSYEAYLYDPENLPGMHEVDDAFTKTADGRVCATQRIQVPFNYIEVDGEIYHFSWAYVENTDTEVIDGMTSDDL